MLSVPKIKITPDLLMKDKKILYDDILYEFEKILKMDYGSSINEYFQSLEKIPHIIKELSEITNKQKLDYCNIERSLMRLYIKNIHDRLSNLI